MSKRRTNNKKKKASPTQEVVSNVLADFSYLAELMVRPAGSRSIYYECLLPQEEWNKIIESRREKRAVADLRRRKLIADRKKGDQIIVSLHRNAIINCLKKQVQQCDLVLPNNQLCLIMFDFPNAATQARNHWRRFLRSVDCQLVQLSIWSSPKNIASQLLLLVKLLQIEQWVKIFVGRELDSR